MGARIVNFEPEKCWDCLGRGWTALPWSIPPEYEATQTLVAKLSAICQRCGGSGLE